MNFMRKNSAKIAVFLIIAALAVVVFNLSGKAPSETVKTPSITTETKEPLEEAEKEQEILESHPEIQTESEEKNELSCTLEVRCDTILKDISRLDEGKRGLVGNGTIFPKTSVNFREGESVFDVLLREMRENKIHLEFVNTPVYNSVYIEGIGNIYEFDAGELSGWMYKVNGEFPNFGCSKYILKNGDRVEFVYTCDLGKDVGGIYYENNGE